MSSSSLRGTPRLLTALLIVGAVVVAAALIFFFMVQPAIRYANDPEWAAWSDCRSRLVDQLTSRKSPEVTPFSPSDVQAVDGGYLVRGYILTENVSGDRLRQGWRCEVTVIDGELTIEKVYVL